MSAHTAHANGNRVVLISNQTGTERDTLARRFAAAVGRDHDAIDRVSPGVGGSVNVWLDSPERDEWANLDAPDGWAYAGVGVADTGGVCVEFTLEADA